MAAAMLVAKRHPLTLFFSLAFTLTWIFTALTKISPVYAVPGLMMPAVAAWIVSYLGEGRFGALKLGNRMKNWRTDPIWYLTALGMPLVLSWVISMGGRLVGADGLVELAPITPLATITFVMVAGEEIGWRGYALPRLLDVFPPLPASIVLGLLWGFWQVPSFITEGTPQFGIPLEAYLVYTASISVIFTWMYNHTRGSLLVATLLHGAANAFLFTNSGLTIDQRWWLTAAVYLTAAIVLVAVAGPDLKNARVKKATAIPEPADSPDPTPERPR